MINNNKNKRNEPCICGSGVKYKKCCMNKIENSQEPENLIAKLISMGMKVNMSYKDCIEVGITTQSHPLDGVSINPITPIFERVEYIPISSVVDYNSIWEITRTGWDSEDEIEYPYINVDDLWVRWDNQTLRRNCGIYEWDERNKSKYIQFLFKNNKKNQVEVL